MGIGTDVGNKAYFLNAVTMTVTLTAQSLEASSIPPGASGAIIAADTAGGAVNWAAGGTTANTQVGVPLAAGSNVIVSDGMAEIESMSFIAQTTTDGALTFQFFQEVG